MSNFYDILLDINNTNIHLFEDNIKLRNIEGISIYRDIKNDLLDNSKFKGYIIIRINQNKISVDNALKEISKITHIPLAKKID